MIYAVSKFLDQIKARTKRHDDNYRDQYIYFDTENEARTFLRVRSLNAYNAAAEDTERARKRYRKNCDKYPPIKAAQPAIGN